MQKPYLNVSFFLNTIIFYDFFYFLSMFTDFRTTKLHKNYQVPNKKQKIITYPSIIVHFLYIFVEHSFKKPLLQ